jgi:hypothetical protein
MAYPQAGPASRQALSRRNPARTAGKRLHLVPHRRQVNLPAFRSNSLPYLLAGEGYDVCGGQQPRKPHFTVSGRVPQLHNRRPGGVRPAGHHQWRFGSNRQGEGGFCRAFSRLHAVFAGDGSARRTGGESGCLRGPRDYSIPVASDLEQGHEPAFPFLPD